MKLTDNIINKRIIIGKTLGFIMGLTGFIYLSYIDTANDLFKLGILLWYTILGVVVALASLVTYNPVLKINIPWYVNAILIGLILNITVVFIAYDTLLAIMKEMDYFVISPFWFVLDGIIIALLIGFLINKYAKE